MDAAVRSQRPFAQLVEHAMTDRGWSVREVARQARVSSHWTVHNCLVGKDVSLSSALKIAAALDLSTGDLGQPGDLK
jgi:hypothetical protein